MSTSRHLLAWIATQRRRGASLREIAAVLNARAVPTPSGRGRWHPSTVKRCLDPRAWAEYVRLRRGRIGQR